MNWWSTTIIVVFSLLMWLAVLVIIIWVPILWVKGWAAEEDRRCRQRGLCVQCGYDLRATSQRCPECGTPVPAEHVPSVV